MADHDHMKAAEPDWFNQAEDQLNDLWATLNEIGDPTLEEAWEAFSAIFDSRQRLATTQEGEDS